MSEVVFEYTGIEEKDDVPGDVTIVRFHSSVTEVSNGLFRFCEKLKEVIFNEGLKKIGKHSFDNCSELKSITFPSTLLEVGDYAFDDCKQLKEVVLNEGLWKIGKRSFYGCRSLDSIITFPSTVTDIGFGSFCACIRLKKVILNQSLQFIGRSAFASCTSLESITIPPTVTDLRGNTFYHCSRLKEIGLHEGIQIIASNAFDTASLETFKFPNLSCRLNNIIEAGKYVDVENKIDIIRGTLDRRGSEVFISTASPFFSIITRDGHWERIRGRLDKIDQLLTYYELREATTLFELAIWKSKIDQTEVKHINRDDHRIDIPGPVKNTILQYLNFRPSLLAE